MKIKDFKKSVASIDDVDEDVLIFIEPKPGSNEFIFFNIKEISQYRDDPRYMRIELGVEGVMK